MSDLDTKKERYYQGPRAECANVGVLAMLFLWSASLHQPKSNTVNKMMKFGTLIGMGLRVL